MKYQTASQMTILAATLTASITCGAYQSWAEELCPSEPTLRSVASTQHTNISFLNGRSGIVNVFWIDYDDVDTFIIRWRHARARASTRMPPILG